MALNEALHKQQRMHTVVKELVALLDGDMHTIQMKLGTLASSWEFVSSNCLHAFTKTRLIFLITITIQDTCVRAGSAYWFEESIGF